MRGGLNVVRSEKYFAHIIFTLNITTNKKVRLIAKSRWEMMQPNVGHKGVFK